MHLNKIIKEARSIRRFQQKSIPASTLEQLIDSARLCPSAANLQPLKYMFANDTETNRLIFPCTAWAGYLSDWPGPAESERPVAYILILEDRNISKNAAIDVGIAAQTIVLSARAENIGACMIGSLKRDQLRDILQIPPHLHIALLIALGYPAEEVVLEDTGPDGSIKYYRDQSGRHHVPKRPLDEVLLTKP